jgi:hypothetical protein
MTYRTAGLAALFTIALMLAVSGASATTITSSEGETPTIGASAEGHVVFDHSIAKIECASNLKGAVTSHGAGQEALGPITSLSFTGCTTAGT